MKQAFPHWSEEKISQTIKAMWGNIGRTIAELPFLFALSDQEISRKVKIHNAHLLPSNGQVIFVSGHLANWEILTRTAVTLKINFSGIYRKANNPYIDDLINKLRQHQLLTHIPKGLNSGMKISRALKNGKSIGMLVDQKLNNGVKSTLFNKEAMTSNAPATFSLHFNCPIILTRVVRKKGAYFDVFFECLNIDHQNQDPKALNQIITDQINTKLEEWITEHPEQWFWMHRRYEKEFYKQPCVTILTYLQLTCKFFVNIYRKF